MSYRFRVLLTDRAVFLPLMKENVERNASLVSDRASVAVLEWSEAAESPYLPADLLVASDCVYDSQVGEILAENESCLIFRAR